MPNQGNKSNGSSSAGKGGHGTSLIKTLAHSIQTMNVLM